MTEQQILAIQNAFKMSRFKGLFGHYSHYNVRDKDYDRNMNMDDPNENPYVAIFAAMSAMTFNMEHLAERIEDAIKRCPTNQLFSIIMNRYNPAFSLANVVPGYILRESGYVDETENFLRGRICHAAMDELQHRMYMQANRLTEYDIMGRMLLYFPKHNRDLQFPGGEVHQLMGRLRLAYAWDIVVNRRPFDAPPTDKFTLYWMGLDIMDVMPELELPLKNTYPGLEKRDNPKRVKYFKPKSQDFMIKLAGALGYGGSLMNVSEDMLLELLSDRCRSAREVDFSAEHLVFDMDAWQSAPFSSKDFIKIVYESIRTDDSIYINRDAAIKKAIEAAMTYWDVIHPKEPPVINHDIDVNDKLLADEDLSDSYTKNEVIKCPVCNDLMYVGGRCRKCGFEDTQSISFDDNIDNCVDNLATNSIDD